MTLDPSTIYVNAATPDGARVTACHAQGWSVVNAPRPLCGEECWQGDFRHGVWYACGDQERYVRGWRQNDAWPVVVVTNEEIEEFLREECARADASWPNMMEYYSIPELAQQYGLPWHEGSP